MAKKKEPVKKKKEGKAKAQALKKVQTKKTIQIKKKKPIKKKVQPKEKGQVKFIGQVTKIRQTVPATVIEWPRSITHIHTYGMLSPFFKGLRAGKLMATRCPNGACLEKRLWIPPGPIVRTAIWR